MKIISKNKIAKFRYELISKFEAGLVLTGSEIKSIRANNVQLRDAYINIGSDNQAYIINMHIAKYANANINNHEPDRSRKLLLHKDEINKIKKARKLDGLTCVPYMIYLNSKGLAKLEIWTAKGKKLHDKRKAIKDRDEQRAKNKSR